MDNTFRTCFTFTRLPVPRFHGGESKYELIVKRAAHLVCTTPEYDALAKAVGLKTHKQGVTEFAGRAKLRAEIEA